MRYYQLHNSNEGKEAFRNSTYYSVFAGYTVVNTSNPHVRTKILNVLNSTNDIKVSDDNSLIITTERELQVLAIGKIIDDEVVFSYPADEQGRHIFWFTPYIDVVVMPIPGSSPMLSRVFLTPGLTLEVIPQERGKNIVLLNNGRYFQAKTTQEEIDRQIANPQYIKRSYPDFSQYPASILWKRWLKAHI